MKGGIKSINTPIYDVTLYDLLKTYANFKMQKRLSKINIPKLSVYTAEEGIKQIRNNLNKIENWKNMQFLIPDHYKKNKQMIRTGLVGIFAASLELAKSGLINVMQKKYLMIF